MGFDILGGLSVGEKMEIRRVKVVHLDFKYASNTGGSHVHGGIGIALHDDDAIAALSFLEPIQDADASWMMNRHWMTEKSADETRITMELKAGRLIPPKYSLAFVLQSNASSQTSVHWGVFMRILLEHR